MSRVIQHWEQNGGRNRGETGLGKRRRGCVHHVADPISGRGHRELRQTGFGAQSQDEIHRANFVGRLRSRQSEILRQDAMSAKADREKTPEQLKTLNEANIKAGEEQAEKINKQVGTNSSVSRAHLRGPHRPAHDDLQQGNSGLEQAGRIVCGQHWAPDRAGAGIERVFALRGDLRLQSGRFADSQRPEERQETGME